jgi:hypothetical protein
MFANQGSLGRMVSDGSDDKDDGSSEEPRMRLEWNIGQDSNTGIGPSRVVHIHTTRSCVGRVSSLFYRLGLSQRFADRAMEVSHAPPPPTSCGFVSHLFSLSPASPIIRTPGMAFESKHSSAVGTHHTNSPPGSWVYRCASVP